MATAFNDDQVNPHFNEPGHPLNDNNLHQPGAARPCPTCGSCPTCGRPGYFNTWPYSPFYGGTVYCGTTTRGADATITLK